MVESASIAIGVMLTCHKSIPLTGRRACPLGTHRAGSARFATAVEIAKHLEPGVACEVADAEGAGECCSEAGPDPAPMLLTAGALQRMVS